MRNEYIPAIVNGFTGIGVILVSFLVDLRLPISGDTAKWTGIAIVYLGMALVVWAAVHVKAAIRGMVSPVLDRLVKSGPYKFVRHPVYLGTTIALVGVAISLRSWPGLLVLFFLFLPSEIHRARLEERALAEKFGEEWSDYTRRTGFFLPAFKKE
jgi:protein-S-isoprenylcysteine O-methyltransferase Ste14